MGRKIRSSFYEISDFPHRRSQIRGPWNTPHDKKNFQSPADFYHGAKGSDITWFCHLQPPPHAQDPKLANAPDPYFGIEGNDVTEYIRYVDMARPRTTDWSFSKPSSDVTQWLNVPVPSGPDPAGDSFWGRTKSYVTDPSVSPSMTPPGKPLDGLGTMDAMTWSSKSKDDQVPLGKSVSKIQSMANALERSRGQARPIKPRGERVGLLPGKRHSPGFPIGKAARDFPPPGWTLPARIPTEWESTYWGKCKSYLTDYAVSPTLTPPGRPLLGEQAKEAMCFIPDTDGREEKIPLGKPVKRMNAGRPHSPINQSPHLPLGNATRKLRPRPHLTPHPNPPPGSTVPRSANSPNPNVPPPTSPPKVGQASPPPPAASPAASKGSKGSTDSAKKGGQANLRWRDQQKSGARPLISPCCDKKKPHKPPVYPVIPCYKTGPKSPAKRPKKKLAPNLAPSLIVDIVTDPHHDVPWFGKAKNNVTDPSVSPNMTPPGQVSRRTEEEREASYAKRKKVPMIQPYLRPPKKLWERGR